MKDSYGVLEIYREQLLKNEKLKLAEAKELYRKLNSTSNTKLKKVYMDKLVLGTLYVVYDYIEKNKILMFSNPTYGEEDIINSFVETWIERVYNGNLMNISQYSFMFNFTFLNHVYRKLGGDDIKTDEVLNKLYGISQEQFSELFLKYIDLKNNSDKVTQEDLMLYLFGDTYKEYFRYRKNFGGGINFNVIQLFDEVYNNLELDKISDLQFSKTKTHNFLKLILSTGIMSSISDEHVGIYEMEDKVINKVFFENFVQDVDEAIGSDRNRDIIHKRYGLDDGHLQTLEEVGMAHHISRAHVNHIELSAMRKLRKSDSMKKYF